MGMYDDVNLKLRMPDGFATHGYQSKSLDRMQDQYEVSATGRLIRTYVGGIVNEDFKRPSGDMYFNGMLNIYTTALSTSKRHEYDLEFVDGTRKVIHCHQTKSEMLFANLEPLQRKLQN